MVSQSHGKGGMDMKYLESRYQRGKQAVGKIMSKRHEYLELGLDYAHAEVVSRQSLLGTEAQLDSALSSVSKPSGTKA